MPSYSKRHRQLRTIGVREAGFDEKWVQSRIFERPAILGLGNLIARDKERPQPKAGRLDLLLVDPESSRRYEVEVQLGSTDESHIVRTVEYWDLERKRYPQYDHCAVIVAEEITGRFYNVISLFNGVLPLIALKLTVIDLGEEVGLLFTKVLDEYGLGTDEEDEEVAEVADRLFWENKGSKRTVETVDELVKMTKEVEPNVVPQYNKHYIGLYLNGQPFNFLTFRPRKKNVWLEPRLPQSDEFDDYLDEQEFDTGAYDHAWKRYKIQVAPEDLEKQRDALMEIIHRAHTHATGD